MVALRLIPCLDVADGRVVKGVNFVGLRDAGDPVELACRYSQAGADELVFLDIAASHQGRATLIDMVRRTVLQESTQRDLQEYLRFRHLVRNLYADELRMEPIQRLIGQLNQTWSDLDNDLTVFQTWLTSIAMNTSNLERSNTDTGL